MNLVTITRYLGNSCLTVELHLFAKVASDQFNQNFFLSYAFKFRWCSDERGNSLSATAWGVPGAQLLAEQTFDDQQNLSTAIPTSLHFETEAPNDDILVATNEDGSVAMQAETQTSLSQNPKS